jgi:hypothetical protein
MDFVSKNKIKCFWSRQAFVLMMSAGVVLSLFLAKAGLAKGNETTQHFKMVSSVEYTGQGQFKNRVELLFTLRKQALSDSKKQSLLSRVRSPFTKKQSLSDEKMQYFLSTDGFDLVGGNLSTAQQSSSNELSFVIDRKTRAFSAKSEGLALFEKLNNRYVRSLKKVSKENIGQTWEQSFDVSFLSSFLPSEMKFTVTAIGLETKVFGEMIAVRALSEPFAFKTTKKDGQIGFVQSKIGAVYVFDPEIEDIYLSISVFEARANINGFKEKLRREVASYMTDAAGLSVDLSGLGEKFGEFVKKVGLTNKDLKVVKQTRLPQWARLGGLRTARVADMCAAMACEGAFNPVVIVCIPSSRLVFMQSFGGFASAAEMGTVSSTLAKSVSAVGSMKIAVAPAFMGMGLGTIGAIAGGTAGAIAIAGGGGGGSGSRSPSQP